MSYGWSYNNIVRFMGCHYFRKIPKKTSKFSPYLGLLNILRRFSIASSVSKIKIIGSDNSTCLLISSGNKHVTDVRPLTLKQIVQKHMHIQISNWCIVS